ncbi:MAG TPA: pyruvate dehydrogenase (acetyl-transferring) E1 component subunit alpha [Alphaproteobacteria bacterium]|jgi:2-oxoisovalerate dehydrogenase E1 component alpha subunit|nr:pyruvate dehydrogenase (acetyl-transferring) E1 component subunit alpha [Alphaproteobacteria bacterium]
MAEGQTGKPDTLVAAFEIRRRQYLDEHGIAVATLPASAADPQFLKRLYRAMSQARAFDAKCVNLQRTGRLGTYATALGQEAVPVGVASAMRERDVLVPSYREGGAQIWRGVRMDELLIYWGGDESGNAYADPRVRHDLPVCITVGNHALHAAGVATAFKLRGEDRTAVCVFGDGATSKGDVYEAFNVAGAWSLPVVFVITNNGWAISTPLERQTAAKTLAQKGLAGGLQVLQVDGNDVIAVHDAMQEALEFARAGVGASLIECLTYRLNDHNTADDSTRYREHAEVEARWPYCPLKRMRAFLENRGLWSEVDEEALQAELASSIEHSVALYLAHTAPAVDSMFAYLHAELPAAYLAQQADALQHVDG